MCQWGHSFLSDDKYNMSKIKKNEKPYLAGPFFTRYCNNRDHRTSSFLIPTVIGTNWPRRWDHKNLVLLYLSLSLPPPSFIQTSTSRWAPSAHRSQPPPPSPSTLPPLVPPFSSGNCCCHWAPKTRDPGFLRSGYARSSHPAPDLM